LYFNIFYPENNILRQTILAMNKSCCVYYTTHKQIKLKYCVY